MSDYPCQQALDAFVKAFQEWVMAPKVAPASKFDQRNPVNHGKTTEQLAQDEQIERNKKRLKRAFKAAEFALFECHDKHGL